MAARQAVRHEARRAGGTPAPPGQGGRAGLRRLAAVGVCALAFLGLAPGCAARAGSEAGENAEDVERVGVRVGGAPFRVELALDTATRYRGLSFRERIPEDGGMLFVFPAPQQIAFVMRDCLVPIDVAFLDAAGRVLALHEMALEPRREGESDADYESRLTRYPSRYRAHFALETAGGRLRELGLKVGERVAFDFDADALKARAR